MNGAYRETNIELNYNHNYALTLARFCEFQQCGVQGVQSAWGRIGIWSCSLLDASLECSLQFQLDEKENIEKNLL